MSDDLRPEYDLKTLLKGGERGKYVERYKAGTSLPVSQDRGRNIGKLPQEMMRVILDAEVLRRDPLRKKGPFRALAQLARRGQIKLYIPEIAAREFIESRPPDIVLPKSL